MVPRPTFLNTGHVMPEGTNAVIMIENIQTIGEDRIRIEAPAFPWQHVRKMGEDIVGHRTALPSRGHTVTPYCIGALIAGGVYKVPVRRKPRVLIIPTGSELVDWRTTDPKDLKPGQVLESNAYVLEKMIQACGAGAEALRHERVIDDLDLIRQTRGRRHGRRCGYGPDHRRLVGRIQRLRPAHAQGSGPAAGSWGDHHARQAGDPGRYPGQTVFRDARLSGIGDHCL